MKNHYTFLLFIIMPIMAFAQYPNFNTTIIADTCVGTEINTYKNWSFYQTENNLFDGTIINQCGNVTTKGIAASNFDLSKKLFIRWKPSAKKADRKIKKDNLYFTTYSIGADLNVLDTNILPVLTIIASLKDTLLGVDIVKNYSFNGRYNHQGCIALDEFCFPTQKFEEQYLEEVIFEFKFLDDVIPNANVSISNFDFFDLYDFNPIYDFQEVSYTEDNDSLVRLTITNIANQTSWFGSNYLVLHNKDGIPSLENEDVKLIKLRPNPNVKQNIILTIDEYESLYFQEFTTIGTENAEESNEKHHLTIEMNGGEMCLQSVELIFEEDDVIIRKGSINFADHFSCLMFKDNSALILNRNSNFVYGENGNGILGLKGGSVILKEGSKLVLDGTVVLKNSFFSDNRIYLSKGSELIFTNNATINDDGYLYIFGNKNQVDLINLDQRSRSKIIFVEEEKENSNSSLMVYPNPNHSMSWLNVSAPEQSILSIYNINGTLISNQKVQNALIWLDHLPSGLYIIKYNNISEKLLITE